MIDDPYPRPETVKIDRLRFAVAAFIQDSEGRVLLQQRSDNGYWGVPGGGIEPGESVTSAVQREVVEETGYQVEVGRLIGVYSDPANYQIIRYPNGDVVHYVTCFFECHVVSGEPTLSDETLALAWYSLDDLPEPFVPAHRIRLRDAREGRELAFVR